MAGNNLLGGGVSIEDITGQPDDGIGGVPVPADYNADNFDSFGGSVQPGKDVEIAKVRVDADTKQRWGYGSAANEANQGYLYVDLQSATPNPVEGQIKFFIESSSRRNSHFVASYDTTRLDASKSDRTQMVPFPLQTAFTATEDSWLVVYLDASSENTDQNVDKAQSEVIIPVTEYDLGQKA